MVRDGPFRTMTVDISELAGNASTDSSTDSNDNDDSSASELQEACEAISANIDSAKEYVDNHGNKAELIEFAERLAEDDELQSVMEQYRRKLDVHRIKQNYLYDVNGEFSTWSAAFYGNSDDPDPEADTYNGIQSKSRNMGGNLAYYKALFPEPAEAYWEQEPVLWEERPDEDAHIYVTQDFASEYSDFTLDDGRPRPPTDEEIASMQGSGGSSASESSDDDAPFAPTSVTVETLKSKLDDNDYSDEQLHALKGRELAGDNRKTAKEAIDRALDSDESDDTSESESETPEEMAGRIVAETNTDAKPAMIVGMLKGDMTEEEVKEEV